MLNATPTWGDPLVEATNQIDNIATRLGVWLGDMNNWLMGNNVDYNYVGNDLWCLPLQNDPSLAQDEKDQILNGGAWGSLGSVIACLKYNEGNAGKFSNCYDNCSTDPTACNNLSRSLVPGFDPHTAKQGYTQTFSGCENKSCASAVATNLANGGYNVNVFDPVAYQAALDLCTTNATACTSAVTTIKYPVEADYNAALALCATTATTCKTGVEAKKNTYVKSVFDQTAYNNAVASCQVAEYSIDYSYCTKASSSNPDYCTGISTTGPKTTDYMLKIAQSRDLASKQTAKFTKRAAYLSDLRTRVNEVTGVFTPASNYLNTMMPASNPAAAAAYALTNTGAKPTQVLRDLVQWFKDHMGDKAPSGLGNDVIYGWFSKPAKDAKRAYGPLHLVRVQSSSPGYRKDLAKWKTFPIIKEDASERIPTIDTDTNWLGTKRTYTLGSRDGYVGARVIRYDEDQGGVMSFLSGLPIWQMIFRNPHEVTALGANAVDIVYKNCRTHYSRMADASGASIYSPDTDSDNGDLADAFIFDLPMGSAVPGPLSVCAGQVFLLLERGMVSESCARYYVPPCPGPSDNEHPQGTDCHYDIQFTSCK
jgi:hypothetical protein